MCCYFVFLLNNELLIVKDCQFAIISSVVLCHHIMLWSCARGVMCASAKTISQNSPSWSFPPFDSFFYFFALPFKHRTVNRNLLHSTVVHCISGLLFFVAPLSTLAVLQHNASDSFVQEECSFLSIILLFQCISYPFASMRKNNVSFIRNSIALIQVSHQPIY
jgi:hypothetical protein